MMTTTWEAEHGAGFAVPVQIRSAEGITDLSWKNDAGPVFGQQVTEAARVVIWCLHPDPERRESASARFIVAVEAWEDPERAAITAAEIPNGLDGEPIWEGDDPDLALRAFMPALYAARKALRDLTTNGEPR